MPWEELNSELADLKAKVKPTETYWLVQCEKDSFSAHPAFLDSHRAPGDLAAMVGGDTKTLRKNRVVTNGRLQQEMPAVHEALGKTAAQYTDVSDHIRLLRHWEGATRMGVVLGAPEILWEAGAFAAEQGPATCADFVHAQAAFLAAGQSLQAKKYVSDEHRPELMRRYYLALEAAGKPQPLHIGDKNVWAAHSVPFVETVQKHAKQLAFGSPQAVVEHALKHLPRTVGDLTGKVDEQWIRSLVDDYLNEARTKINDPKIGPVTSALDQCAGSRTYYFGEVTGGEVTMVAVNHTGLAWISTYYAPHRV